MSLIFRSVRGTAPNATWLTPLTVANRAFTTASKMSNIIDSALAARAAEAERTIQGTDGAAEDGPSAKLQQYLGKEITPKILRDITAAEKKLTGRAGPIKGGPVSVLLRATQVHTHKLRRSSADSSSAHSGTLDSATLSKITAAEKEITGEDHAVKGGPTSKAQSHANEPITSEALHDITEGEKNITGGERIKGGPTSTAQSELAKSRD